MQLAELRNRVILRGVIYLLILIAVIVGYSFLASQYEKMNQKNQWLGNDINSLRGKINMLDKQRLDFAEAVGIWKGFSEEEKQLKGIQISEAEKVLKKLEDQYPLSNVNVTFSKPVILDVKSLTTDSAVVEVSDKNNITFSSFSDEKVYQFIEALQKEFPGYVKITKFTLNRLELPSVESLRLISQGKTPALVNGSVEFTWYALKAVEPKDKKSGANR